MIKIGVSACFIYPDLNRTVFGPKTLNYLEQDMARYLSRFGAFPVLIPNLEGEEMDQFLSSFDGFVFQGGTDISPLSYGEPPLQNSKWPGDPVRDDYELKVLDYAIKQGKPVLGICRGMQLLNIYFGGTLFQDISTQYSEQVLHRDAMAYDKVRHQVSFPEGSLLDVLHGQQSEYWVNSVHHQGIKDVGKDLEVLAYSIEDQLIEALQWSKESPGKVMGVQWHPEFFRYHPQELIDGDKVYQHFLSFC